MKKYPNKKNELYNYCQAILHATSEIIRIAERNKLTDEQFFIDFEDKLNELSIKDHNKIADQK